MPRKPSAGTLSLQQPGGDAIRHPCKRLALLIDADNVQRGPAGRALDEVRRVGHVAFSRVFGNLPRADRPEWTRMLVAAGIPPPAFTHQTGRDGADFVLTIEAMDLLHRKRPDGVCLLSGDGGFAHLVRRLRKDGLVVHVFAGSNAASSLRRAASGFHPIVPRRGPPAAGMHTAAAPAP